MIPRTLQDRVRVFFGGAQVTVLPAIDLLLRVFEVSEHVHLLVGKGQRYGHGDGPEFSQENRFLGAVVVIGNHPPSAAFGYSGSSASPRGSGCVGGHHELDRKSTRLNS